MTPAEEAAWAAALQPEAWSSAKVEARRALLRSVEVPQILDALVRKATRPGAAVRRRHRPAYLYATASSSYLDSS